MAFSITGQALINQALTALGILEQGGTPNASDSTDSLAELNTLWDSWGIDEGLIYSIQPITIVLSANKNPYVVGLGAGADKAVAPPQRIYKATLEIAAGASQFRRDLTIVEANKYFAHGDLKTAAQAADELYPDYNVDANGNASLYLFPVPIATVATTLELIAAVPFVAWALGVPTILPYAYTDGIQYALAARLLPRFGVAVQQQVAAMVIQLAQKAEVRIRDMNAKNRQLTDEMAALPSPAELTSSKLDKARAQLPGGEI